MSLPKMSKKLARTWLLGGKGGLLALLGSLIFFASLYQVGILAPHRPGEQAELTAMLTAAYAIGMLSLTGLLARLPVRTAAVVASLAGAAIAGTAAITPWPAVRLVLVATAALTAVVPTYGLGYVAQLAQGSGTDEDVTEATMGVATAVWNVLLAGAPLVFAGIASASGVSGMLAAMVGVELLAAIAGWRWIGPDAHSPGRFSGKALQSPTLVRVLVLALAVGVGAGTIQTAGLVQAGLIGLPTQWLAVTSVTGLGAIPAGRWARHAPRATWVAVLTIAAASFAVGALDPHVPGHAAKIVVLFAVYAGVLTATGAGYAATMAVSLPSHAHVRAIEAPLRTAVSFVGMVAALPMAFLMLRSGFTVVSTLCAVLMSAAALVAVSYGRNGFDRTETPASPTVQSIHRHHRETRDMLQRIGEIEDGLLRHTAARSADGGDPFDAEAELVTLERLVHELQGLPAAARRAYESGNALRDRAEPVLTAWLEHHGRNLRSPLRADCEMGIGEDAFTVRVNLRRGQHVNRQMRVHLLGDLEQALDGFPEPVAITIARAPRGQSRFRSRR